MSFEVRNIVEYYIREGYKSNKINVGTVSFNGNKPTMNWNSLDAWEELIGD